ncbi:hypothetical protein BY996DRAFT_7333978 [Phakopsora pachyrhizi]|nr:hypothetical protein BY996DRAFT_7333978 [Phakopsora pachyrhizi]
MSLEKNFSISKASTTSHSSVPHSHRGGGNSLFPQVLLPSEDDEGLVGLGIIVEGDRWPTRRRSLTNYHLLNPVGFFHRSSRWLRNLPISTSTWYWFTLTSLAFLTLLIHLLSNNLKLHQTESESVNFINEEQQIFRDPTTTSSQRNIVEVLIILPNSGNLIRRIDEIVSSLSDIEVIDSLTALCPNHGRCPKRSNLGYVDSLLDFRPGVDTQSVLVLDTPLWPWNHDWIDRALSHSKRPTLIAAAVGVRPRRSSEVGSESLICSTSSVQGALIAGAPFVFPAHEWPSSLFENSEKTELIINNALHLSFLMSTELGWKTSVVPLDTKNSDQRLCQRALNQIKLIRGWSSEIIKVPRWASRLAVLIGSQDFQNNHWKRIVCGLVDRFGAEVYIIDSDLEILKTQERIISLEDCISGAKDLRYDGSSTLETHRDSLKNFFENRPNLEILISLKGSISGELSRTIEKINGIRGKVKQNLLGRKTLVLIELPLEEVEEVDWILGLNLEGLRNWHKPKIEISVITNDRPKSLNRLLRSLKRSNYFGDRVNLVINMEQTSDPRTRAMVSRFDWDKGTKTVRQRIILGGLLPAVIESWYPSSPHDSYGVLLEDDTEVSVQFYGWLKFAVLSYRYSGNGDNSIYGVSLYQPQFNELNPEGRRPFNASALIYSIGREPVTLAYASQVPCSWGALFFPEFWTSFQRFLTFRLADRLGSLRLEDPIVAAPIRSNRWPKSWKKYMIEWVYLRGSRMIYPNYRDGSTGRPKSLSTNHLEPGTHVRVKNQMDGTGSILDFLSFNSNGNDRSGEKRLERLRRGFEVELMETGFSLLDGLGERRRLPIRGELINIDLWGELTSSEEMKDRGWIGSRSLEICSGHYDDHYVSEEEDVETMDLEEEMKRYRSKEVLHLICGSY